MTKNRDECRPTWVVSFGVLGFRCQVRMDE